MILRKKDPKVNRALRNQEHQQNQSKGNFDLKEALKNALGCTSKQHWMINNLKHNNAYLVAG